MVGHITIAGDNLWQTDLMESWNKERCPSLNTLQCMSSTTGAYPKVGEYQTVIRDYLLV